jgi:hypothetical protein
MPRIEMMAGSIADGCGRSWTLLSLTLVSSRPGVAPGLEITVFDIFPGFK